MAQPLSPQSRSPDEPRPGEEGAIFRYVCGEDGELRILQLPATLENLLDPRLEDEVTQSEAHAVTLGSLFDVLRRYLKRLAPELAVFSDLLLLYRRHGHRDVTPDIAVVEGLGEARRDRKSLDVVGEGGRLVLVMEVVSESSGDARRKDEEENPKLFAELGVEDLVLVYPPESGRPLRVSARRLARPGVYRTNAPDSRGRILLRSVGLWLSVDAEHDRLVLVHRETGERLLTAEEEEAARREAERRTVAGRAETVVRILESRGLPVSDEARRRILAGRDLDDLDRWTRRAFTVETTEDLWAAGG